LALVSAWERDQEAAMEMEMELLSEQQLEMEAVPFGAFEDRRH